MSTPTARTSQTTRTHTGTARVRRTAAALVAAFAAASAVVGSSSAASAAPAAATPAVVTVAKDHGATDFGYVTRTFSRSGIRYIKFDRAVLLTGDKARAAKAAHGLDPNDGPDYYIQNDNPRLRTYALSSSVKVYGSQQLTGSPALRPVSLQAFVKLVENRKASAQTPFTLMFKGGKVIRITERYLP
jgi:hypothetical protein